MRYEPTMMACAWAVKRVISAVIAVSALGLAGCILCTPIDNCEADSECPVETPRCDVENGFCVEACDDDDDCTLESSRCDVDKGFCVFQGTNA